MSIPPEEPGPPEPLRWEDLADLRAGMLTAEEEERLRILMDHNPELAQQMMADLEAVEAEFPDPPHADDPLHVPPHVAARWQTAIAHEAERRAHRHRTETCAEHDSPKISEQAPGGQDAERPGESG